MDNAAAEALKPMKATSDGVFQGENPLHSALPLAILQICIVVVLTRVLAFILRPLRQPRVIAEIIGGILLGPSALGHSTAFLNTVFPKQSLTVLDTLANIGLLYFLFLVGLELDLRAIRRTGSAALVIAVAGISLPFIMGIGTSFVLQHTVARGVPTGPFLVFIGVALSITAFPVLARILAELKLLTTDLGRMVMSAAAINDVVAWIFLALAIALSGSGSPLVSLWVLLAGAGFVLAAFLLLRPVLTWMARRSPEGEPVKELYICGTLAIVLAAGFATDTIGIHALFGAFIVGIVVPKDGPFAGVLLEKVEDLISSLFLPLYFVSSGLKTNVMTIKGGDSWALLVLVVATACIGKIGGTVIASLIARVPFREALTLGFLMNTKGLVELIILNIGKDRHVLNDETFAILVLMALITTFITTPVVMAIYKPARRGAPYKNRAVQRLNPHDEFRMMACFHSTRNIPTIINLMESSRGTRKRGITVYAMHLVELSERSSAISMVHKARRNGMPFWNKRRNGNGDQLVVAFETYQQLSRVSIRAMTAISDLQTIHEDVVTSAHQKRAALIVLPFHKLHQMDGHMESLGNQYQHINQRVLHHAPCSVGILVDRGLGGAAQVAASDVSYTIVVIFFGGRDDREALAYGMRMVEHPGIGLHVLRFLIQSGGATVSDRSTDDAFLEEFRTKVANGNDSVRYEDKPVGGKEEVVEVIKATGRCNLFLVGQGTPCMPLADWSSDCPELGPVGTYLALPEFSTVASVMVMKQYDPTAKHYELVEEVADIAVDVDTPGPSNRGTNTSFRAG
ncbi:cation/H(+) antiporter 19 [Miscanthus floridulus]|uniref:cation/H(+) antiporter 19 n=1 Tax=Miscanthus floridulus TaxID=154761 RepID=UPI003457DC99